MLSVVAPLMASVAIAAPVSVGRISCMYCLSLHPIRSGGAWIEFGGPREEELAKIAEDGSVTAVRLPPRLREEYPQVMALRDGWIVVTNRYWPGGQRETDRCLPINGGVPEQEKNCGVLVVAQYSPSGHWTPVSPDSPPSA